MAGGWGNLQHWNTQAAQPAAPAGQRQMAQAAAQNARRQSDWSNLGTWTNEKGYVGAAQSWYTGANQGGTENGWNTDFWDRAMRQQEELGKQGRLGEQFETSKATGVVTWDHHAKDDPEKKFHFGDVYDNGRFAGNVYKQFDKNTADLMMADLLFDTKQKAEYFSDSDPRGRLRREVRDKREMNNEEIPKRNAVIKFQEKTGERAEEFRQGPVDEAITGAAGLATGGIGAGIGTVVAPGPGTLIGGGIGLAVGGIGAWLNRDALTEQAARAYEITAMSKQEHGTAGAVATGVTQWAGFAGKLVTPLSNLTQGAADAKLGKGGDGVSEFYRTDKKGDRTAPAWLKVADVVASIGDAGLQFATPIGLGMYTAQMGTMIGGEVTEAVVNRGDVFDYASGDFKSTFSDDEGNFDFSRAAAGIGKIGIDVVQLGMVRGLAGKVDAARLATGEKVAFGGFQKNLEPLADRLGGVGGRQFFGRTAEQRAALEAGGQQVHHQGYKFVLDKEGQVVGPRIASLSLLAPSEQIGALGTRLEAMRLAAKRKGAYSADDFYTAAQAMSTGERRLTTTLINGFGEGYEEGLQYILDQHSTGNTIKGDELANSMIYGAAMGLGMGFGMNARMPTADQKMKAQARSVYELRMGKTNVTDRDWDREWSKLDQQGKETLVHMSQLERATLKATFKKIKRSQSIEVYAGTAGADKLADAINTVMMSDLAKATRRTDGSFVIVQTNAGEELDEDGNVRDGSMPTDAVGASAAQTTANVADHLRGVSIQLESLRKDKERLDRMVANDPTDETAAANQAKNLSDTEALDRVLVQGKLLLDYLEGAVSRIDDPNSTADTRRSEIYAMNKVMSDAYHRIPHPNDGMSDEDRLALSRAATMLIARDPHDHAGSYQMLLPQVNELLTETDTNDLLQIGHSVLTPLGADYDGDKVRPLNQLILDEDQFIAARSGAHYLGAGGSVNISAPAYEEYIFDQMTTALTNGPAALTEFADSKMRDIGRMIRNRYLPTDAAGDPVLNDDGEQWIGEEVLEQVLTDFYDNIRNGNSNARAELLDALATRAGGQITKFARTNLSNEWLWIDQVVRSTIQRFQEGYAAHRPDKDEGPDSRTVPVNKMSKTVKERIAARAAVPGFTLSQRTPGISMFRKFQKLHYASRLAAVLSAKEKAYDDQPTLLEQAAQYEELGQGLTKAMIDEIGAKDEISGRVLARLQVLADDAKDMHPGLNRQEALVLVANLRVADLDVDAEGNVLPEVSNYKTPSTVSLVQMLLKQSLAVDRREKDAIFEASPELQRKHARIADMTKPGSNDRPLRAESAFVEVFGAQTMYELLGEDAVIYGPQLTVEQWVRQYNSRDEDTRKHDAKALRKYPAYLGRKRSKDLPYDLDEVSDKEGHPQISAFRALTDAMVGAGNARITSQTLKDGTYELKGEIPMRSNNASLDFHAGHKALRRAVKEYVGLTKRRKGESDRDVLKRMFKDHPDYALKMFDLVPNATANAVFQQRGKKGKVYAANWVFDMFLENDPVKAEAIYWRELLLAELNALQVERKANEEESDPGAKALKYNKLPRQMHRVVWGLAASPDKTLLQEFLNELTSTTDVNQFIRWVNTTPGVRGNTRPPLTAWVDDVAEFDQDKSGGGWTTKLAGSELREAIKTMRQASENMVDELVEEKATLAEDKRVRDAIKRAIAYKEGSNVELKAGDLEMHDQMQAVINDAADYYVGLGPAAMMREVLGAVTGFEPQEHTKAKNPPNTAAIGTFEAEVDANGYVLNYDRMLASMTALDLDSVAGNFAMLAKDDARSMDDFGREINWLKPTVKSMVAMLDDPRARPQARAVLFPQVKELDFDGVVRTKMLLGKSLKALLDGSGHNDLFADTGNLSQDSAMRYLSMLNARARKHGGHQSVIRALNAAVISKVTAADHVLSHKEREALVLKTAHELARTVQAGASIAARRLDDDGNVIDPSYNRLHELRDESKRLMRMEMLGRRLRHPSGKVFDEIALQTVIEGRRNEAAAERTRLTEQLQTPGLSQAEADDIAEQIELVRGDLQRFEERISLLLADDSVARMAEIYDYDTADNADPVRQVAQQQKIVEYINLHLHKIQAGTDSIVTLGKLTEQMRDQGRRGNIDLTHAEWDELSRLVIAFHIDEVSGSASARLTVTPYPDQDRADDQKLWDPTYSSLLDEILDTEKPIIKAGIEIHRRASRHNDVTPDAEFARIVSTGLMNPDSFGEWTPDIPRAVMFAGTKLDAAAAEAAVSIAGQSPKLQGVFTAALKRTFKVPTAAEADYYVSSVTLDMDDLENNSVFDEVDMTRLSIGAVTKVPLAQLNNRFARSVMLDYTDENGDPQQIDLLATVPNLRWPWVGNEALDGSGLFIVHRERIKDAVTAVLNDLDFTPTNMSTTVEFFHPDSQPADPSWYNSLIFEGTSFSLDADEENSLTSTLWFQNGSLSPSSQAAALQASKKGLPAMRTILAATKAQVDALEGTWRTDFTGMLRGKTRLLLETDMGFGRLDVEFYNAIHKDMKIRHFVRGKDAEGNLMVWSAEQVVAWQAENPGADISGAITDAELWIPNNTVLRSLLGEQGLQGVHRLFPDQLEVDLNWVKPWQGVTDEMLTRFKDGFRGDKGDFVNTRIGKPARQSLLQTNPYMNTAEIAKYDKRLTFVTALKDQIYRDRAEWTGQRGPDGWNPRRNLKQALDVGKAWLEAENIAFDWIGDAGISHVGPRKPIDIETSKRLFEEVTAALDAKGGQTGWVYAEGDFSRPIEGFLNQVSLGEMKGAIKVAPGDPVVVQLDRFRGDEDLMKARLQWFVDQGALVILGSSDGSNDLITEAGTFLRSLDYSKMTGSKHVYRENNRTSRYQNVHARVGSLTEVRGISRRNRLFTFLTADKDVAENTLWVNRDSNNLGSIAVQMNLVPVDAFAGFGLPATNEQVQAARQHLMGMDNAAGMKLLLGQANGHIKKKTERKKADAAFIESWQSMMQRFKDNPDSVLPGEGQKFGTGDFVPLVDNGEPSRVLLYRHGYQAPKRTGEKRSIETMMAQMMPGSDAAHNVAVYPSIPEKASTTHWGNVVEFRSRNGYGLQVELEIPLKFFGDKMQLEWNGMKYLTTPMPKHVRLPEHGIFPDRVIDGIASIHDTASKEATDFVLNNFGNAWVFTGADFHADVAKFFGTDVETARNILEQIARKSQRISPTAALEVLTAPYSVAAFRDLLREVAGENAQTVDPGWVNRIGDDTSIEGHITKAMIVYLSTDGARVEDVIQSGGFNDPNPDPGVQSQLMPALFTEYFDRAQYGSELRNELIDRINAQVYNPNSDGTGYRFLDDFKLLITAGPRQTFAAGDFAFVPGDLRQGETVESLLARKLVDSKKDPLGAGSVYNEVAAGGRRPIQVRPGKNPSDPVTILDGHERLAAAIDLGLTSYPVVWEGDGTHATPDPVRPPLDLVKTGVEGHETTMEGWLQFSEAHSSGDNPIKNGMSYDTMADQAISPHSAAVAYGSIGARTANPKDLAKARAWAEGRGLVRFADKDAADGGAWRMVTNIDVSSGPRWRQPTPGEAARMRNASKAVNSFRRPLKRSDKYGWDPDEGLVQEYKKWAEKITKRLNLDPKQVELVDYWVRQMAGEPDVAEVNGEERGWISAKGAVEIAKEIFNDIDAGYLPTASAMVPMLHVHDLQAIYRANRHHSAPWSPRTAMDADAQPATQDNWREWVSVSIGSALTADTQFERAYLLALDGMMHSYQRSTSSILDLPVSMDQLISEELLNPETNRMIVSFEANTDLLAADPVKLDAVTSSLAELLGGRLSAKGIVTEYPPAHEISKRRERIRKWRKETGAPYPVKKSVRNLKANGDEFIHKASSKNALIRMMIDMRIGMALLNPQLWVSMGPEMWVRGALDRLANTITGQSTVGLTAKMQSRVSHRGKERSERRIAELNEMLREATKPKDRRELEAAIAAEQATADRGGVLESLGLTHRYTPKQMRKFKQLFDSMGDNNDFKSMVYGELFLMRPHDEPTSTWIEKGPAWLARAGTRMQDPTWGMKSNTMARRYVDALLQHYGPTGTLHNMSADKLIATLTTNVQAIKDIDRDAHKYAMNALGNFRSLKDTPAQMFLRGIYEPLSNSENMMTNFLGNVLLKIPLMFSGYAANVATTILGLQGLSDMTAMFLHGRSKGPNSLIGRVQAKIRGDTFNELTDATFDMTSVLEGVDLSRSFVRGALTHTGLFAFGMMAGGLGLSGEDDETKKRRKMAALQGAGFVYDPRKIENDFRNSDAIYADLLPFGLDKVFQGDDEDGRSMFQPSWMLRQFLSPIIGMERFFETGDWHHVMWGFQDAVGSFPLINAQMWNDAVETSSGLVGMADKAASKGTNDGIIESMGLLTQAVGVYERMLFESSFVNGIYIGRDKYDRDPYVLPLRDSDGVIQRDIEGEARAQNISVHEYIAENRDRLTREIEGGQWAGQLYLDPENGEVKEGYLKRDGDSASLHAMTENRASLAMFMSITNMFFGGGSISNSSYFRQNMVPKTRKFDKPEITEGEAKAFLLGAYQGAGGQQNLDESEIRSLMIKANVARGVFDPNVDAKAAAAARAQGPALLEMIKDGKEALTADGAKRVYYSLAKGSVHFGDASLAGLYIPREMREKIQDEMINEITQEGVNLGLDKSKAISRAKRLWYGPTSDSKVVGMGDLLWSDKISYDPKLQAYQLNTTYVMGPDGLPWATGWSRGSWKYALGLEAYQKQIIPDEGLTGHDTRNNTTYLGGGVAGGLNTGLRALEFIDKSRFVPTDVEIGKSIEAAIKKAAQQDFAPFTPFPRSGGGGFGGFTPFRRFGGGGGGFGGFGGGGGGFPQFNQMRALPHARAPFSNSIPFINTSNPLIRRADIRRERVWSERGRLKQWQ